MMDKSKIRVLWSIDLFTTGLNIIVIGIVPFLMSLGNVTYEYWGAARTWEYWTLPVLMNFIEFGVGYTMFKRCLTNVRGRRVWKRRWYGCNILITVGAPIWFAVFVIPFCLDYKGFITFLAIFYPWFIITRCLLHFQISKMFVRWLDSRRIVVYRDGEAIFPEWV